MSLSVIPLTILGQITGVTGSGETALYQVSFKSIDGTPLYGVTAVWTDEQAEIEALAAQKPYGVWINPIDGTFTVKFAGYTYTGTADLTDSAVLAGITLIEFNNESGGGSSDFSTCQLTYVNNAEDSYNLVVAHIGVDDPTDTSGYVISNGFGDSQTVRVILYKGAARASFQEGQFPPDSDITVSGDIEYDAESDFFYIAGDGAITVD